MDNQSISIFGNKIFLEIIKELKLFPKVKYYDDLDSCFKSSILQNSLPIIFLDEKNYIAAINNSNLNLIFKENTKKAVLKGKFLNDNIYVNLSSKKTDNKPSTDLLLKISKLNLLIKSKFPTFESYKNISSY